jgi:hypothetical protein
MSEEPLSTYSISCHCPKFSFANADPTSVIITWYGAAFVVSAETRLGFKARPRIGEARYERHKRTFIEEIILNDSTGTPEEDRTGR